MAESLIRRLRGATNELANAPTPDKRTKAMLRLHRLIAEVEQRLKEADQAKRSSEP